MVIFFPLGIVGGKKLCIFLIIILIDRRVFGWPRRERATGLENVTNLRTVHRQGLNKNEVTGEKAHVGFPGKATRDDFC